MPWTESLIWAGDAKAGDPVVVKGATNGHPVLGAKEANGGGGGGAGQWELIQFVEVSSGPPDFGNDREIVFADIPQNYKLLRIMGVMYQISNGMVNMNWNNRGGDSVFPIGNRMESSYWDISTQTLTRGQQGMIIGNWWGGSMTGPEDGNVGLIYPANYEVTIFNYNDTGTKLKAYRGSFAGTFYTPGTAFDMSGSTNPWFTFMTAAGLCAGSWRLAGEPITRISIYNNAYQYAWLFGLK